MKETAFSIILKILIVVTLVSLFGCTMQCPDEAVRARVQEGKVVLWCQW